MSEDENPDARSVKVNLEDRTIIGTTKENAWPGRGKGRADFAIAFLALLELQAQEGQESFAGVTLDEMVNHPLWTFSRKPEWPGNRKGRKRPNRNRDNLRTSFRDWQGRLELRCGLPVFQFHFRGNEKTVGVETQIALQPYVTVCHNQKYLKKYLATGHGAQAAARRRRAYSDQIPEKLMLKWAHSMAMARLQINSGRAAPSLCTKKEASATEILETFLNQHDKELGQPYLSYTRLLLAEAYIGVYQFKAANKHLRIVQKGGTRDYAQVRGSLLASQMQASLNPTGIRALEILEQDLDAFGLGPADRALFHQTMAKALRRECVTAFRDGKIGKKQCEAQMEEAKRQLMMSLRLAAQSSRADLVELAMLYIAELLFTIDTLKGIGRRTNQELVSAWLNKGIELGHEVDKREGSDVITLVLQARMKAKYERNREQARALFVQAFDDGIKREQISLAANAAIRLIDQIQEWATDDGQDEVQQLQLEAIGVYRRLERCITKGAKTYDQTLLAFARDILRECKAALQEMGAKV